MASKRNKNVYTNIPDKKLKKMNLNMFKIKKIIFEWLSYGVNRLLSLGNKTVSLTLFTPVRHIVNLSAPRPQPA